jgi:hypothetical protein
MSYTEKPVFDLSGLSGKKIKIRVGDPLKIDIPFSGAPTPVIDWAKESKTLESQPRCQVSVWIESALSKKIL